MDRSTDAGAAQGRWLLYRIDDNGNEVAMRRFARREDAEAAMHLYEARGHKQAYVVHEERHDRTP
ncbi:hypothetical protein [Pseudomonas oryzae]|uniref:SPOR domain-containing protein n=1 Tax=Pseudomonas oryzae TaxID=1392877 RepID=A0A1H1L5G1_9PSED|nr:hypothetical protein [Pseudomonas oryzae]SDR69723.1 hypothetical protein SAMN05216221_0011 [Pseudomonas oryzae]